MKKISHAELTESLCRYFSEAIELVEDGNELVALMPHKDPFGDSVTLYLRATPFGVQFSDGGFAHHELAGLTRSSKADAPIWTTVRGVAARYGVDFDGGELNATASDASALGSVAFALASCISESLHVARLGVSSSGVQFWEEVELFFRDNEVSFETGFAIPGVSGARHRVDFALRNKSLHIAQAIASEQSMRRSLNIFYDVTEADREVQPVAFVDDDREGYSNATFQQLAYKAKVFRWRKRSEFVDYWHKANRHRR
jgi:hypothetical protein